MSSELVPYNENESEENEKKARRLRLIILLAIILIIIIAVLTFGWFNKKQKKQREIEREKKAKRLAEVEIAITKLQLIKEKIERREKFIKIGVRLGIAALLIWANLQYKHRYISHFDFEKDGGTLLNLNACIVSFYTFVAFVSYGSIDSFVRRMKEFLIYVLNWYHLFSIEELESLKLERDQLKKEIDEMDNPPSI